VLGALLSAADRTAEDGEQLRTAIAAAGASDDYDTLADAPRVAQRFTAMRDQLREMEKLGAVAQRQGCVTSLQLEDGAKAATISSLAKLGGITPLRTKIAHGLSAAVKPGDGPAAAAASSSSSSVVTAPVPVTVRPLQCLHSRVLPRSSEATLLHFFGGIPVGHSSATAARPQRDRGRRAVVSSRFGSPSR
jgi:hypothetical protein